MSHDRVDEFLADIAASPGALTGLLDAWRPVDIGGRRRFAFVGLGSSRFGAMLVAAPLRAQGRDAWVDHASAAEHIPAADDLVLVAISASGGTREVLEVAERHRGRSVVVAVTNEPGSRLARVADLVVPLLAGQEASGIACRSFRATVAAVALLSGLAQPDELRPAVAGLADRIDGAATWLDPMVTALHGAPSVDVIAGAATLGLAEQGALMLREAPRLPAHAWETADWLHTAVYLALPGHRAVLLAGSPADAEVVATVERRGGQVVTLTPPDGAGITAALVTSVVPELIAAGLWQKADAIDKEP